MKPFNASLIADLKILLKFSELERFERQNIPFKDVIELKVVNNDKASTYFDSVCNQIGNITALEYVSDKVDRSIVFPCKINEYFIPITGNKTLKNCKINSRVGVYARFLEICSK
jgi:valyl-tRNA synthetase